MKYKIVHRTFYEYVEPVGNCVNIAYVMPRDTRRQTCLDTHVLVTPFPATASERRDYFGNRAYHFAIEHNHQTLEVSATSIVDVLEPENLDMELDFGNTCGRVRELLNTATDSESVIAKEYCLASSLVDSNNEELRIFGRRFFHDDMPFLSCVRNLTQAIYREFEYDPLFSDVSTPLQEVLKHKKGVCQDFAHLAIASIRANGFPARYVSGYLETLPPPGREKLVGTDASHAWFAVYSPGEGWFEFDPTNDQIAGQQHIVTAWGRDYADVPPLRGIIFGGGETHKLKVSVDVSRVA